jgi:hypothetical protein
VARRAARVAAHAANFGVESRPSCPSCGRRAPCPAGANARRRPMPCLPACCLAIGCRCAQAAGRLLALSCAVTAVPRRSRRGIGDEKRALPLVPSNRRGSEFVCKLARAPWLVRLGARASTLCSKRDERHEGDSPVPKMTRSGGEGLRRNRAAHCSCRRRRRWPRLLSSMVRLGCIHWSDRRNVPATSR